MISSRPPPLRWRQGQGWKIGLKKTLFYKFFKLKKTFKIQKVQILAFYLLCNV